MVGEGCLLFLFFPLFFSFFFLQNLIDPLQTVFVWVRLRCVRTATLSAGSALHTFLFHVNQQEKNTFGANSVNLSVCNTNFRCTVNFFQRSIWSFSSPWHGKPAGCTVWLYHACLLLRPFCVYFRKAWKSVKCSGSMDCFSEFWISHFKCFRSMDCLSKFWICHLYSFGGGGGGEGYVSYFVPESPMEFQIRVVFDPTLAVARRTSWWHCRLSVGGSVGVAVL